jgi:hypothetical protein
MAAAAAEAQAYRQEGEALRQQVAASDQQLAVRLLLCDSLSISGFTLGGVTPQPHFAL